MVEQEKIIEAIKFLESVTYKTDEGEEKKLCKNKIKLSLPLFELQTEFLVACENIPKNLEYLIPDSVSDIYNLIVEEDKITSSEQQPEVKTDKKEKIKTETNKKKTSFTRVDSIYQILMKHNKTIHIKDLAEESNQIYAAAGKKDNIQESKFVLGYVINTLTIFGIATVENNIITLK